ncbi:MAG: glycosyltransferase family 4 protein [Chloroflexi bacterium]|nr:glycosyltransferase family 4 protein [Chloroflexota bacterium]
MQSPPSSVTLVARRHDLATGLGRYAASLARALPVFGVSVRYGALTNPLPRPVTALLSRAGRDADTLFDNYGFGAELGQSDVYHLTSEYHAPLLLRRHRRPVVITVNGFLTYFLHGQPDLRTGDGPLATLLDRLVVLGLRQADAIIAVSQYVKTLLVQRLKLPPASIRVIQEGVDTEVFRPASGRRSVRERLSLDPDRRWILYVGSEQGRKNFLGLIRAFADLRRERPDLELLKVGQPEVAGERRRALSLARELGVLDHIRFAGHAGDADLRAFYNAADVFVFPSLCEGFGLPPLEAMACGVPVVCANTSSLPEVVGDAAAMCAPTPAGLAEAIARVLDDPTLAAELRGRGRDRACAMSWTASARATAGLYAELRNRGYGSERAACAA